MSLDTESLVGKIAVQKGLITPDQLRDCLAQQAILDKVGQKRPLGVIMASRGLLKDEDLVDLLEEQKRVKAGLADHPRLRRQDFLSGQDLVRRGEITPDQLDAALRRQAEAAERGTVPLPRLREILSDKAAPDPKATRETLIIQYKAFYDCPGCGLKFNLLNARADRKYRCKKCGEILVPMPAGPGVKVDESAYGLNLEVSEDVPPEVAEAERDPVNRFDKYVLIREIGRGAMGSVHKAYQKDLKRTLAVKILRGDDPETMGRFQHEAQMVARLKHPNIVSLYEIGKYQEIPFLAMEYVEGKPLDELGKLPPRKACAILREAALAVHYAHEKGIIHRDLKPANIIVDRNGRPFVTDFGLARKVTGDKDLTTKGFIVGTPAYMSPEQAQGVRHLGPQSDVASLGSVLYQLLTGIQPYTAKTPMEVALAVINHEPIPPCRINSEIPPELEAICLKAMAKGRSQRYSTARAFAEDLQRFLDGEPVLALRPGLAAVALSRLWRNRPALAIAAVSLAALAVLLAVAVRLSNRARRLEAMLQARAPEGRAPAEEAPKAAEGPPPKAAEPPRPAAAEPRPTAEERRQREAREAARREALDLVDLARKADQLSERVSLAERAIQKDPYLEEAYAVLAQAYDRMGFSERARKDLSRAIELAGNPLPYLVQRAEISRRLGCPEDEIRDLGEAIRIDGRSADLFHRRGTARFVAQDFAGAIADLERAIELDASLRKPLEPRLRQARQSVKP